MRILRGLAESSQNFQGGTLTIGKFDGLHLGHRKLLETVRQGPKPWVLMTFDPLPLQFLRPEMEYGRLMPREDLETQLPKEQIDVLQILTFDKDLAGKSAEQFATEIIWERFQPKKLVVGYDFAMGKGREGNLAWLTGWCERRKIGMTVVEGWQKGGKVVSSGRVRELIQKGDVAQARELLGRPFYLRGEVVHGAGRGRTIGVPTLNQRVRNETLPALGVYATRVRIGDKVYNSVTNVGRVPTFTDQSAVQVETHVMGEKLDAYGETIEVDLIQRLREEKKFASVEDLKNQIRQDILEAGRILENA